MAIEDKGFNAEVWAEDIIQWIRNWFKMNGDSCNAVIGISGGKDSTVAAGLLVKALGRDRVIGVKMPDGEQKDIDDANKVIGLLGIKNFEVNIKDITDIIKMDVEWLVGEVSSQTALNAPPRVRMAMLYAISQSMNGRVCNTCNFSEEYVGYSTKWGDNTGDFAPLMQLTATEVKQIGLAIGLPRDLIEKPPADGLTGKTDEEIFGFTYAELDKFLMTGVYPENDRKAHAIIERHKAQKYKRTLIDCWERPHWWNK